MRFYELLLEYNRNETLRNLGMQISQRNHQLGQPTWDDGVYFKQFMDYLEGADPTPNKKYTLWVIRQYIAGKFRIEDVYQIQDALRVYDKYKAQLPLEQRDIGRLTLSQLYQIEQKINNVDSSQEIDTSVKGAKVLYNGPLGLLVIPETMEAACQLGRGTKWCTSATNNNQFDFYNEQGSLYIWQGKPGGAKFQFHYVPHEELQFMDALDRPITSETFKKLYDIAPLKRYVFDQYEQEMLNYNDSSAILDICMLHGKRWPDGEKVIISETKKYGAEDMVAVMYAKHVIKGRWADVEPLVKQDKNALNEYVYALISVYGNGNLPKILSQLGLPTNFELRAFG